MTPRGSGLLSVIVPVLNEEDNIPELVRRLKAALDDGLPFDIIFVDDGSTDSDVAPSEVAARGGPPDQSRSGWRGRSAIRRRSRPGSGPPPATRSS